MSEPDWLFSLAQMQARLDEEQTARAVYGLRRGSMRVGLYAPIGVDPQTPHPQDELYIIVAGSGQFSKNGERRPFKPQDVIFVEAGADHRFEGFTADFSAWVIFWGPEGGGG